MRLLGLTGGPGMGKSTTTRFLQERCLPAVDTDELARRVVEPGQPALAEAREAFGPQVIAPDGRLRRDQLARIVFADAAARKKLEQILHPRIRQLWREQAQVWQSESCPLAFVVIPLLFETSAQSEFDSIICVACSANSQRTRLLARGWTLEHIQQRISAQLPIEHKMARSDYVIWTEGDLESHSKQLDHILARA